jgi:hypothetical protein
VDFAPDTDDDEFTELVGADFPRVDLVSRPANGAKGFFVMKQDASAGLMPADMVRDLISKTSPEEAPVPQVTEAGEATLPNGIVLKGSPAAMAAFIHAANVRKAEEPEPAAEPAAPDVAKADMSTGSVNDLPDSDFGYIEPGGKKDEQGKTTPRSLRHFPLNDAPHVRNALSRAPQSPFGDKAMPKIRAAAKRFKIDVAKEAGVADQVTKDMMDAAGDAMALDDGTDGMDPTVPLAAPDDEMDIPGDPTDPGSPAWEAIDAATAQKWLSIAARLKNALCLLAEREMLEAASADPDDAENAWDLQDAACAVDFAIEQLAVFASGEQAEAEIGAEMAEMCKAIAGCDPASLAVLESLAPASVAVRKAGRVLSSANEAKLRSAAQAIGEVLSSLPQAPDGVAKSKEAPVPEVKDQAAEVAKEATPEAQAADAGPVSAGGTTGMGDVRETGPAAALPADGPQAPLPGDVADRAVVKSARLPVVVYDRAGRQCITRPDAIRQPVAKADDGDAEKPKMQAVFDQDGDLIGVVDPDAITPVAGAAAAPAADPGEATPAPPADDTQPQPPADAGTPADAVGKAADENVITIGRDVLKGIAQEAARDALEAQGAAHQEVVAKMAADNGELREELKVVKERLVTVENSPAAPGVFTNGAVPPKDARPLPSQGQLRGQDQGSQVVDLAKSAEIRKQFLTADPAEQNRLANEMQRNAIATLAVIHGTPVPA